MLGTAVVAAAVPHGAGSGTRSAAAPASPDAGLPGAIGDGGRPVDGFPLVCAAVPALLDGDGKAAVVDGGRHAHPRTGDAVRRNAAAKRRHPSPPSWAGTAVAAAAVAGCP